MMSTLTRNVVMVCSLAVLCAALVGCSSSGDDSSAMAPEMMPPGDGMTPEPDPGDQMPEMSLPTDPQAIAAATDRVKDATGLGADGEALADSLTGFLWHFEVTSSGSKYTSTSQSYQAGSRGLAVPWYDEDGNVGVIGGAGPVYKPLQSNPEVWPFRGIYTPALERDVDGVTNIIYGPIEGHGLGAGWQGIELIKTYEGGGTLTFRFFTDLEESDSPGNPFVGDPETIPPDDANYPNIVLDAVPVIPAGWDNTWVFVPEEGLHGSLNGVVGTFTCGSGSSYYCGLENGRHHLAPGYTPAMEADPVIFTPDNGSSAAEELPAPRPAPVRTVNYLSFGNWLYVPEDVTNVAAVDFGVFAGGGDPFMVNNLEGLAGIAEYEGEAAGMYAETENEPMISRFNAKVALTADFGMADDFGAITGSVEDFNIASRETSPLTKLNLQTVPWRGGGTSNIFESWYEGPPFAGGWIEGTTSAEGGWEGRWGGKFFGNGATTDHPASFAGTFGATDGDHSFVGSFGAHKQ